MRAKKNFSMFDMYGHDFGVEALCRNETAGLYVGWRNENDHVFFLVATERDTGHSNFHAPIISQYRISAIDLLDLLSLNEVNKVEVVAGGRAGFTLLPGNILAFVIPGVDKNLALPLNTPEVQAFRDTVVQFAKIFTQTLKDNTRQEGGEHVFQSSTFPKLTFRHKNEDLVIALGFEANLRGAMEKTEPSLRQIYNFYLEAQKSPKHLETRLLDWTEAFISKCPPQCECVGSQLLAALQLTSTEVPTISARLREISHELTPERRAIFSTLTEKHGFPPLPILAMVKDIIHVEYAGNLLTDGLQPDSPEEDAVRRALFFADLFLRLTEVDEEQE